MKKHLDASGKGMYSYDVRHDILLFKIKERDYWKSLEFDDIVADIDKEGFITGIQVFDASKLLRLEKEALSNLHSVEFGARVENGVISLQIRFLAGGRKPILQGQDFVREAPGRIEDSEVLCTVI